jgi:hypothetical protein
VGRSEYRQPHVDRDAEPVGLVRGPVVAGHAVHLVLGAAADEDVVAPFADEFVEAAAAEENIVTGGVVGQEWGEVVARRAVLGAFLDPVVAFVARFGQVHLGALAELDRDPCEHEVVALAAEDHGDVVSGDEEVLAIATQ